jgi:hypothetical protein
VSYIMVLDQSPKAIAEATADVHLRPTITTIAKILSTGVRRAAPTEVKEYTNGHGVRRYIAFDQIILPPLRDDRFTPWVEWVLKEYNRAWWLVTLSWFLDKELISRFGEGIPPSDHLKVQEWVKAGITRAFTKNNIKDWDFPVVLPNQSLVVKGIAIDTYREYYKTLPTKARMKWTGRGKPLWMTGIPVVSEKEKCGVCTSDVPDARMCPVEGCPRRSAYNL